jgi:hypothetical protein
MWLAPLPAIANETIGAPAEACSTRAATIDRDFPTGAFAACEAQGTRTFHLTIAPEDAGDINCSAWYAFRLSPAPGARRKTSVQVTLDYTTCGHRYRPKISSDGVSWVALPRSAVEITGEGDGRSARIAVPVGNGPVFIAAQEILPPSAYDAWLETQAAASFAQRSTLGQSTEGRDIDALTLADPASTQRETVVLVGRQHPPEVTGALAMLPFVETLMGDSELAKAYRARFETIVVPLLNPDGVVRGHWRHNTGGVDLNRDWGPFTQPETRLMQGVLQAIAADPERHLRVLIDFHSTGDDVFYTIPDELPTDPPLFTRNWLALLQERMPDYTVNRDARHASGRPISKAHAFDTYGVPGITFEIGDDTDRDLIQRIGRESAIAMMYTLLETPLR